MCSVMTWDSITSRLGEEPNCHAWLLLLMTERPVTACVTHHSDSLCSELDCHDYMGDHCNSLMCGLISDAAMQANHNNVWSVVTSKH